MNKINSPVVSNSARIQTYRALGILNLVRVALYRFGLKLGVHPAVRIRSSIAGGLAWKSPAPTTSVVAHDPYTPLLFGRYRLNIEGDFPKWHLNQWSGATFPDVDRPWWRLPDFSSSAGDVKAIWELSRFDWAPCLALESQSGNRESLVRLNSWFNDWCSINPPYQGPNWKCGQEASIRIINCALTSMFLGCIDSCSDTLSSFIEAHLKRISPTISYAIAQDNNHGTTEAVGLFVGASWLGRLGHPQAELWESAGRSLLEERVQRLIGRCGTFSQYSTNYHRLMLDTLSVAEVWRRRLGRRPFADSFYQQARLATDWLFRLTDAVSGDVPNVGANDGARFFHFLGTDYRDFRPSVQLASVLFADGYAYESCPGADRLLSCLELEKPPVKVAFRESGDADDGGFAVMHRGNTLALLRYPQFCFRPSQSDALHVDLFAEGTNVLRDGGTFSYNTSDELLGYFAGTASHNTIQFDHRDQMPRLSRFLFAHWLKTIDYEPLVEKENGWSVAAGYRDYMGACHQRQVTLEDSRMIVGDTASGQFSRGVLRWRLQPGNWQLNQLGESEAEARMEGQKDWLIRITCSIPSRSISLSTAFESRYYLEKTVVPVIELEFDRPCNLITVINW